MRAPKQLKMDGSDEDKQSHNTHKSTQTAKRLLFCIQYVQYRYKFPNCQISRIEYSPVLSHAEPCVNVLLVSDINAQQLGLLVVVSVHILYVAIIMLGLIQYIHYYVYYVLIS